MADGNGVHPGISIDDLNDAERQIGEMIRQDHWQNIATNLGVENKDHRQSARYVHGREIPQQEYDAMYREDPVFAKIVDGIPEHGTRKWIKVTAQESDGEDGSDDVESDFSGSVLDALEDLDAQQQFFELWRLARLDGGAAMIIGANDGRHPEEPLELEAIQSVDHLNVLSRFEIFPVDLIDDVTSPHFREPEFYIFAGRVGSGTNTEARDIFRSRPMTGGGMESSAFESVSQQRIHHSRIIRMRGIVIADSQSRNIQGSRDNDGSNSMWGTPIVQRVYDDLRQYNTIFAHVEAGFKDMAQGIMGIKNLPQLLAAADGNELLMKRMALIALAASSFNMVLFDPEHESYEKRPGAFAGVDAVLLRFMEKLSSAAEIPMTKLFGMAPAGLSTDDQSAEKTFNASIANKQRRKLRTPLNRVIEALLHAKEGPTGGNVPGSWKVGFIPLDEPNEGESAATAKTWAEVDGILMGNGVIDEVEARSRLKNNPDQPYTLNPDRDKALEEMSDPLAEAEAKKEAKELGMMGLRAAAEGHGAEGEEGPTGGDEAAGDEPAEGDKAAGDEPAEGDGAPNEEEEEEKP